MQEHWVEGALCFFGGLVFSQGRERLEMYHGGSMVDDITVFRLQPIESSRGIATF